MGTLDQSLYGRLADVYRDPIFTGVRAQIAREYRECAARMRRGRKEVA